jgi:CheY-like chemotaxis protein
MIPISADLFPGDMKARLAAAGCRDFISKPFDVIELIALVKTVALERKLLG